MLAVLNLRNYNISRSNSIQCATGISIERQQLDARRRVFLPRNVRVADTLLDYGEPRFTTVWRADVSMVILSGPCAARRAALSRVYDRCSAFFLATVGMWQDKLFRISGIPKLQARPVNHPSVCGYTLPVVIESAAIGPGELPPDKDRQTSARVPCSKTRLAPSGR